MPPENAFWYHLAYTVAITVYTAYAVSIWWRRRAVARRGVAPQNPADPANRAYGGGR